MKSRPGPSAATAASATNLASWTAAGMVPPSTVKVWITGGSSSCVERSGGGGKSSPVSDDSSPLSESVGSPVSPDVVVVVEEEEVRPGSAPDVHASAAAPTVRVANDRRTNMHSWLEPMVVDGQEHI